MNTETTIKPQPKLILPFLAWNFGWTWGFWLLDIILKNLWPDSPPTAYLALEAILNGIAMFGLMLASLIVLKKKGFKAICSYLFSGKKETWLYLLIYGGGLTTFYALASGGKLVDGALVRFPWFFIYCIVLSGGIEEFGWRGFLQPALEKKFSFFVSTLMTGIIWAIWHIPLWFYDRFYDRSQDLFSVFIIFSILLSFWLAALYKKTQSVLACNIFHALSNTLIPTFVGIAQANNQLDFSQVNPFFYFGGVILLTLYSIYLWYRTDREEKALPSKEEI